MADDNVPFRADEGALLQFGDAGRAPVLSYDVPQPAEYNGRYLLELQFGDEIWTRSATAVPPPPPPPPPPPAGTAPGTKVAFPREMLNPELMAANAALASLAKVSKAPSASTRSASNPAAQLTSAIATPSVQVSSQAKPARSASFDTLVRRVGEDNLAMLANAGAVVVERRNLDGTVRLAVTAPPDPTKIRPRIAIVHACRLSSYLGEYGAGRTISTFSLLPGEQHEIEIKTYKRTKTTTVESSSILDSYESTVADEFASDLMAESSSQSSEEKSFGFHAEAEAKATFGFGSASASGGVEGSKSSKREEFAKNVASTTQKHAATAASKRQVEINTSSQTETEAGEETATKRIVKNINVGRTLNFVFRQMNQVFVTVLSLVDIRIAFENGDPAKAREYTLPDLEEFLKEMVVPASRDAVRDQIWAALYENFDWRGEHAPLVEAVKLEGNPSGGALALKVIADPKKASFWRFRRQAAKLDPLLDGAAVTVPGAVLGVNRSTLPTDGVVVDALLGQGNALDAYSMGLQMAAVDEKHIANAAAQAEVDSLRARIDAAVSGDAARAEIVARLLGPAVEPNDG